MEQYLTYQNPQMTSATRSSPRPKPRSIHPRGPTATTSPCSKSSRSRKSKLSDHRTTHTRPLSYSGSLHVIGSLARSPSGCTRLSCASARRANSTTWSSRSNAHRAPRALPTPMPQPQKKVCQSFTAVDRHLIGQFVTASTGPPAPESWSAGDDILLYRTLLIPGLVQLRAQQNGIEFWNRVAACILEVVPAWTHSARECETRAQTIVKPPTLSDLLNRSDEKSLTSPVPRPALPAIAPISKKRSADTEPGRPLSHRDQVFLHRAHENSHKLQPPPRTASVSKLIAHRAPPRRARSRARASKDERAHIPLGKR